MAEEEVSVLPSPADNNKRKLDDIETPVLDPVAEPAGSNGVTDGAVQVDDVVESDAKRPRLDDSAAGLEAKENGSQDENLEERHDNGNLKSEGANQENLVTREGNLSVEETQGLTKTEETQPPTRTEEIQEPTRTEVTQEPTQTEVTQEPTQTEVTQEPTQTEVTQEPTQTEETQEPTQTVETQEPTQTVETQEPIQAGDVEIKIVDTQEDPSVDPKTKDHQETAIENIPEANTSQVAGAGETKEMNDVSLQTETVPTTRKIDVPGSKVGVLIGKGGETIKYLQYNSGAKIQILRDAEADPDSSTRPVELIGSLSSIEKAEKLIQAVITEAEAGGSPSLIAKGLAAAQAAGGAEQIEMPIPFDKVGLIIGRRGETIKSMQSKSGARIQLIQEQAEGAGSKEKIIRVSGNKMQIEAATEMIKDVMNQITRPPMSGGYNQPHYRPRGPTGPPHWGSRGPHGGPPMPYDYNHRGPYPPQNSHYHPPPPYGGYPPQNMPPRGGYGPSWDQRPPHSGGYDYYGRQGSQNSAPPSAPASGHAPGPLPPPAMGGPPPSQGNYGYGQSHSSDYGHGGPYNQTAPQQSYGNMYEQPKYDTPPPMHQPYGGGSQPGYPPSGGQPGYNQPQQHVKPYGVQGPGPQGYGPSRAAGPNDMPYPGVTPPAQSYGANPTPQQQQYPYGSSAPMQQNYPSYNSGAPSDGYSQQAPPATGPPTYQQQGVQPSYGQQATYGSYPSSQQTYSEQPAQHNGSYAYQGSQDPSYGGGSGSAYAAAPTGGQQAYPQATQAQPGYDQSATQSAAGYAAAPGNVPAKSPQPGYPPQYDANQVYAAPR